MVRMISLGGVLLTLSAWLALTMPAPAHAAPAKDVPTTCASPHGSGKGQVLGGDIHTCVVHGRGEAACPRWHLCLYDDDTANRNHVDCFVPALQGQSILGHHCGNGRTDLMLITDLHTGPRQPWPNEDFPVGEGSINLNDYLAVGQRSDPSFLHATSSYVNNTDHDVQAITPVVTHGKQNFIEWWYDIGPSRTEPSVLFTIRRHGQRGDRSPYVGDAADDRATYLYVPDWRTIP